MFVWIIPLLPLALTLIGIHEFTKFHPSIVIHFPDVALHQIICCCLVATEKLVKRIVDVIGSVWVKYVSTKQVAWKDAARKATNHFASIWVLHNDVTIEPSSSCVKTHASLHLKKPINPKILTIKKKGRYGRMMRNLLSSDLIALNESLKGLSECGIKWFIDINESKWKCKNDCIKGFYPLYWIF